MVLDVLSRRTDDELFLLLPKRGPSFRKNALEEKLDVGKWPFFTSQKNVI